ncbi:DUF6907 domain-containing protein [Amycolatopsis taiwanensis]|uniref:DUF6907 domain-containing protein n=1 Tax=Amycolatopsis taiwanensis TaxID=342230 RepID=UPI0012EC9530|nr:hypothetical protein [Amycolatopsis taiwanensis]
MSKPMPYWQTIPCPPWCEREHHEEEFTEHRVRWPADDLVSVVLTANDPVRLENKDGSVFFEPAILRVDLSQHIREAAPRVLLGKEHSTEYSLTPGEAVELGHAPVKAGQLAGTS